METLKTETLIDLHHVWKVYQMDGVKCPALKDVSLEVKRGEFLAIVGRSGSGKSTMINLVGCLDVPTEGRISLDKDDIADLPESDLSSIRGKMIGFVFQRFNLIPTLNALENVMLPMEFQDVPEEECRKRARELMHKVGLGNKLRNLPSQLSGGEIQRVAIARALSTDPDIILADEPTGNLDSVTSSVIMRLLRELHKEQGKTIVLVTHDMELAKHADRIIHLKDGRITDKEGE